MSVKPFAGCSSHLVGVGGIGMSALAQLLLDLGCVVGGSDRSFGLPGDSRILDALAAAGVALHPQDGSFAAAGGVDAIVVSSAIETDNPDLAAAPGVPRQHRSAALAAAMEASGAPLVAVTGSCGKTTVSAWLGEAMVAIGTGAGMVTGGVVNRFVGPGRVGNYHPAGGGPLIFEADESDKSLTAYRPDYTVLLNVGTDHYAEGELLDLFELLLRATRCGAVVENSLLRRLAPAALAHLRVSTFAAAEGGAADWRFDEYRTEGGAAVVSVNGGARLELPAPGRHTAANAVAVLAALEMLGVEPMAAMPAMEAFSGVWRRFDEHGTTRRGVRVVDDYAHNVEKLISCYQAAREVAAGRVVCVFQPHGFAPLEFMRKQLFTALERNLAAGDMFGMLPVYYAGGTAAFKPSAAEVIGEYRRLGAAAYHFFPSRGELAEYVGTQMGAGDLLLLAGARDNSLSEWAAFLADGERKSIGGLQK